MLQRTNKILIGKDIDRDAALTAGVAMTTLVANINDGEVIVLDKNKKVLAAGSTVADTDTIYICQGLGETYDYTNPQGTAVTGVRKVRMSDPIEAAKVKSYKGVAYDAKSEQTDSWVLSFTATAGVEYVLHIVYKDPAVNAHPARFTQTYRYIAKTGDAMDDVGTALAAAVNKHAGRRVNATYTTGTDTLLLTAREIPAGTTSLDEIDEFAMVEFESFLNYVDSLGNWQTLTATLTRTAADYGSGEWEQIRDIEKATLPYLGVYNKTHFPIMNPDLSTVKNSLYDLIVIEHDKSYLSPDNQYVKDAPLTTIIAIATNANGTETGTQTAAILSVLNPWMASTPGAFANITV